MSVRMRMCGCLCVQTCVCVSGCVCIWVRVCACIPGGRETERETDIKGERQRERSSESMRRRCRRMIHIDGGAAVHVHHSIPMHLSSLLPFMTAFTRTPARTQIRLYTRRQVRAQARMRARTQTQTITFKPHFHTRTCLHTRTGSRVWGEATAVQVQGRSAIRHALPRHSCTLLNVLSSYAPSCHSFLSSLHFNLGFVYWFSSTTPPCSAQAFSP
eukprot:GHVU01035933.1.p1 GENE.GHVU01035933.1~~GHVU01035933.1.p1  ORF type:complete len:215 (+),score=1.58 GHVU01035933.1:97-741(+)